MTQLYFQATNSFKRFEYKPRTYLNVLSYHLSKLLCFIQTFFFFFNKNAHGANGFHTNAFNKSMLYIQLKSFEDTKKTPIELRDGPKSTILVDVLAEAMIRLKYSQSQCKQLDHSWLRIVLGIKGKKEKIVPDYH